MRFAFAFGLAVLAAIETAILSFPVSYWMEAQHAPKSEFRGLALFGAMMVTAMFAALATFASMFVFALLRAQPTRRWKRLLLTFMCAVGTAMLVGIVFGRTDNGLLWAIGINAAVLAIGLFSLLSRSVDQNV